MRRRRGDAGLTLSSPDLLSDGVIELRPLDRDGLDLIERAARDPEIRRRWPLELAKPSAYLTRYQDASRDCTGAALAISDVGAECSGLITIELRRSGRAELGYWLLPEGRGQGRATRALELVSGWALSQPGIARLQLLTAPDNLASQRVAERSGFRREGLLRSYHEIGGRREDVVLYSLLRDEFEERARARLGLRAGIVSGARRCVQGCFQSGFLAFWANTTSLI
jgi:RimJ/RimL family protein N-acetyltransferase